MGAITAMVARSRTQHGGFWLATGMLSLAIPVSVAWRVWVSNRDAANLVPYSLWLPGFLACFAGGALVAHLAEGYRHGIVSIGWLRRFCNDRWAPLVLALAVALLGTSAMGGPAGFPDTFAQEQVRLVCATVLAITLLMVAALGGRDTPLNRVLSTSWATAIGRWSYGIFLWHFPLLVIFEDKVDYPSGVAGFVIRLGLVLALSIPLSAATYAWVERPTIAWSQRARTYVGSAGPAQRERTADLASGSAEPANAASRTSAQATAPVATDGPSTSAGE
jgi:peptidoglycan/LPS O-acetylase OafA/YrhL